MMIFYISDEEKIAKFATLAQISIVTDREEGELGLSDDEYNYACDEHPQSRSVSGSNMHRSKGEGRKEKRLRMRKSRNSRKRAESRERSRKEDDDDDDDDDEVEKEAELDDIDRKARERKARNKAPEHIRRLYYDDKNDRRKIKELEEEDRTWRRMDV